MQISVWFCICLSNIIQMKTPMTMVTSTRWWRNTWVTDARSVDTATIVVAVERFTPVTDDVVDTVVDDRVKILGVIHLWVVTHQHVVHTRLLHCRHLVTCPLEVPGDLRSTVQNWSCILETCTGSRSRKLCENQGNTTQWKVNYYYYYFISKAH